jgi:hypothetical protein
MTLVRWRKATMTEKFPAKLPRATKRSRGRTAVTSTPVTIRGVPISPKVEDRVRRTLVRRIGHAVLLVERGTVRFEDINGPRGGVGTECRIKLVLSGRPSVQAHDRARGPWSAFSGASFKVRRALASVRGKHALATGVQRTPSRSPHPHTVKSPRRARASSHDRTPMKLETARRAPSRKGLKVMARRAKHRVGMQR